LLVVGWFVVGFVLSFWFFFLQAHFPLLVAESVSNMRIKLEKVLAPYFAEIKAGLPVRLRWSFDLSHVD
jgi:hypothetical protein